MMEHIILLLVVVLGPGGDLTNVKVKPFSAMESCAIEAHSFLQAIAPDVPKGDKVVVYCTDLDKALIQEEGYVTNPPEIKAGPEHL